MYKPVTAAVAAALVLLMAACGDAAEEEPVESPQGAEVREAAGLELTERCVNPEIGYTVAYPASWHTNPGTVLEPCRIFDPDPIDLEPATEIPLGLAVSSYPAELSYAESGELLHEDPGFEVRATEETEVDGQRARVVEGVGTGFAMLPEGVARYGYTVDLGEGILTVTTYDLGDLDLETKREVLDEMMDSFELTDPEDGL